jgi:hypothetical protein
MTHVEFNRHHFLTVARDDQPGIGHAVEAKLLGPDLALTLCGASAEGRWTVWPDWQLRLCTSCVRQAARRAQATAS